MVLEDYLRIVQIILSFGVVILIILQAGAAGAGNLFGGTSGGAIQKTRRGLEKTLFQWTIFFSAGFLLVAILQLLIA
jgi:preprotein translocase subunit SecG